MFRQFVSSLVKAQIKIETINLFGFQKSLIYQTHPTSYTICYQQKYLFSYIFVVQNEKLLKYDLIHTYILYNIITTTLFYKCIQFMILNMYVHILTFQSNIIFYYLIQKVGRNYKKKTINSLKIKKTKKKYFISKYKKPINMKKLKQKRVVMKFKNILYFSISLKQFYNIININYSYFLFVFQQQRIFKYIKMQLKKQTLNKDQIYQSLYFFIIF
ncbi:transmembrane protein, putative (macronuclear) [Tetrahymena thermophila SB210]|uniref:Transmembrane protein, putative n=1 Tax=Tetrahymena thermophila (strain SB210) TaxID=312017 RepID=W7XG16_TETTS|nr:transmembrane protein, putative [Tetrahymena thermophila SB210]EWS73016.1 transmembrane protein, putative [Tetrahymena thermophila SB210]|eukprot:XP_012654413.1 transmembrane protein, putative [Tetrahymena thermophila SB210]